MSRAPGVTPATKSTSTIHERGCAPGTTAVHSLSVASDKDVQRKPWLRVLANGRAASEDERVASEVTRTLAEFEAWYAETHSAPFWVLFEEYLPETPRVDF